VIQTLKNLWLCCRICWVHLHLLCDSNDIFITWIMWYIQCSLGLSPPVLSPTSPIAKILVCPDFPPLKIPRYTAKLSYRHPPQVLNPLVSTAHNYFVCRLINYAFYSSTTFLWQLIKLQILLRIKNTNVITRKVNTGNYSN
jgi:hypothetical protein